MQFTFVQRGIVCIPTDVQLRNRKGRD